KYRCPRDDVVAGDFHLIWARQEHFRGAQKEIPDHICRRQAGRNQHNAKKDVAIKRGGLAGKLLAPNLDRLLPAQVTRLVVFDKLRPIGLGFRGGRRVSWYCVLRYGGSRHGSGGPHHNFVFELYAISFFDAVSDLRDQRQHVASAGPPGVHKEVGVAVADTGFPDAQALEPEFIDHAPGGGSGRIFEDAAGAFLPHGLTGAPLFVADANSLDYFTVRFGGKIQRHCEHHIIRRKRSVTVFKRNLIAPEDFYLASGSAIDLDLL